MSNQSVEKATLEGMGAICASDGIGFRVWAPNANEVGVIGSFQDWKEDKPTALVSEGNGFWYGFSDKAKVGDEYKFRIRTGDKVFTKIDPYAREVTNSVGNGVIYDPTAFDWTSDSYQLPPKNELVIYELHLGTFAGDFASAATKLRYLKALGVNAIEIMPIAEFAGELSWGYNPAQIFAVESSYGGGEGFREFVVASHSMGIGVILDVVYNHFGPSDLDLWDFDGSAQDGGGIYFYPGELAKTPWGHTRPDYSADPVRRYIRDNLMMWFNEYNIDGVRTDGTVFIRKLDLEADDLPEGWSLLQWLNEEAKSLERPRLMIAEDLQSDEWMTKSVGEGGAGFDAQWDARFCHPVREMLSSAVDQDRSPARLAEVIATCYNGDPFQSVIYTESHDEVANGNARLPTEIDSENPESDYARKRSLLGLAIVLTSPGIPMLFQAQERLATGWFEDTDDVDWSQAGRDKEVLRVIRDLIQLRTGATEHGRALTSHQVEVLKMDDSGLLVLRRGTEDSLIVAFNLHATEKSFYLDFPHEILVASDPGDSTERLQGYGFLVLRPL